MAKKNDTKLDDFNLDDFDLDFNFTDGPEPTPKNRNPVIDTSTKALKGFKGTVANKSFIMGVLRKALPKGFVDAYDQADKVVTKGRSLYNQVAQDVRPAYNDLERAAREISPIVRAKGKTGLSDMIDKTFGKAQASSGSQKFDPDEATISQSMAELFRLQAEDGEKKDQKDRAVEQLKDRTDTRRHTDLMGAQSIIANGMNQLVGYQKQVTSRYQQKMLELNFRQYYAQRDLLGTLQAFARDTHTQMETVVHNTALPDILKMQASEQFVNQARARMFGKVQERVSDHFRNYTDKIFENVEKEVRGFGRQVADGMSMASQLIDAQRMGMEYGVEDNGLAGMAGSGLGHWLGSQIGKRGQRFLSSKPGIRNAAAKIGYRANNIPEALNELRGNNRYYGDWRDKGMDVLRRVLPGPFQREINLQQSDDMHGGAPTTFDNQTHKSINEIIPGYLSRILQSLESARQGKPVSRLVYNTERNAFTEQRQRTADVADGILDNRKIASVRASADSMVSRLDADNTLSPAARKALADTLIREADAGNSFSPSNLANGSVSFSEDGKVHREIADHMRKRYNVDAFGKLGNDAENYNRAALDSSSFKMLRETMPDVYATINRMVNTGNAEDLRALGILVEDPNNPRKEIIDYSFLQTRMAGGDWNINDVSGLGENGKGGRGRGSKGRPPGAGRQGPTPGPTPPTPSNDADSAKLASLFDKFTESFKQTWAGFGQTMTEQFNKLGEQVDALGAKFDETSTVKQADESIVWLSRIAKILSDMKRTGMGSRRRPRNADGDADFDDVTGDEDWDDWQDEDGDIWDRTRGRVRRGKGKAKQLAGAAKAFGGRQLRKAKVGVRKGARFARDKAKQAKDWVLGGQSVFAVAGNMIGTAFNAVQEVFDIYTSPDAENPVMTAAKMRAGLYHDAYTYATINKFSDIKGPVLDDEGNVVLTEEDIRRGLYGKNGKPVGSNLMRGVFSATTSAAAAIFGVPGRVVDLAKRTLSKALSIGRNLIDGPEDVYVKGEDSPRLLAIIMRRKGYRSKTTSEVINRPSDIDGPVLDIEGNEVLSAEDITKGLVDSKGRPVVGLGGKLLRWAKSGFGLATKAAKLAGRAAKFAWDKTKKAVGATARGIGRVGRGLWNGLTKGINFRADIGFGVGVGGGGVENVVHGLEAIYNLLNDRLPGRSKFRTGSWQEKFSKNASPKDVKKKIEKAAESNPLLKYLMMFGGVVMSGFAWVKSKFGQFFDGIKTFLKIKKGADVAGDIADVADDLPDRGRRPRGKAGIFKKLVRGGGKLLRGGGKLVMGAGRLAMAALPFAGEALMGLGSAVAGLVTAPVAIAVGVAAAGYFAYKYFKGRPQPFQRLRLAEYGFDPSDKDAMKKVIEMEGTLLPNVAIQNGRAVLNNVNTEDLLQKVGIGEDPNQQRAFMQWYQTRFGPVFLRNVAELRKVAPNVSLLEVDDKLDKSLKADYATATKDIGQNAPYRYGGQPFSELDALTTGTKVIDEEIASIRSDFAEYKKPVEDAKTPSQMVAKHVPGAPSTPATPATNPTGTTPSASANSYVTPSDATGGYEPGIAVKQWSPGSNRLIDDLTAIRMRLYGLSSLDISQVNALTTFETNLDGVISIGNDGKVKMTLSPDALYKQNAGLFGRNPTDFQSGAEWIDWFNLRFLPVYSQFLSTLKAINANIKPALAWKYLRPADMLSIAQLLKAVHSQTPEGSVSVWGIKASAFSGMTANTDISSIDTNIQSLQSQVKNNTSQERTPNAAAQSQKQGSGTTGANQTAAQQSGGSDASKPGFFQRVKNWFTGGGEAPSAALGGAGFNGQSGSYALGGAGVTGPAAAAMGTPIAQPGNGTGGDINQIPQPEGDGSWDALKKTIVAAANMAGVDPGLMASMAFVESNFRAAVKPGTSAAQGLYQFIPSTWRSMMRKYATKYGIDPNTPPSDPRANALMGAEYLKENQKILEQKLGRPVTGTDLYLSHFLGGAGGPRLLKAPSGDLAQNHADASAVNANKTVFFAGGRPKTVAEVIAWANKRIEGDGGKFMSEANALAGNPQALKAANDPSKEGTDAANDAGGAPTTAPVNAKGSDDGQAAFAATQQQAASLNNAATGMPTARSAPTPTGAGSGPSAGTDAAPMDDYTADVRSSAQAARQSDQLQGADAMLDVQRQQLEVQQTMSSQLERLIGLFGQQSGGPAPANPGMDTAANLGMSSPGSDTPQNNPSDPRRNGGSNAGAKKVTAPISMRRTG